MTIDQPITTQDLSFVGSVVDVFLAMSCFGEPVSHILAPTSTSSEKRTICSLNCGGHMSGQTNCCEVNALQVFDHETNSK